MTTAEHISTVLPALDRIKQIDAERTTLAEIAKAEAMNSIQTQIALLLSLGTAYELRPVTAHRASPPTHAYPGSSLPKSVRASFNPDRACPICGVKTSPAHDARTHRNQSPKVKFTAEELSARGLAVG